MEIKYTTSPIDKQLFGKNKVCGLYDREHVYLNQLFPNMTKVNLPNIKVSLLFKLKLKTKHKKYLNDILSELELDYITKRNIKTLSDSEIIKLQAIYAFLTDSSLIVLTDIDKYLNYRDLANLLKTLKNYIIKLNKTVVFETSKVENMLNNTERYIIVENNSIVYLGDKFKEIPIDYDIKEFVTLANSKGAKLDLYKDESDLLKAIYRSVK